ncbi:hypothetical protein [Streptomyces halobius]|uniref:Uncharacterized protein n=1 Tax=Streptomyces halobius TaxID=2879846 RepID=A0ABY4LYP1_9ACTN|nr:hypothetical protein [Streptomyces halobius]UQA90612.1 hypothetical protein K9S39_00685 [Streptomyces halobius]
MDTPSYRVRPPAQGVGPGPVRAVDSDGNSLDLLARRRDTAAAGVLRKLPGSTRCHGSRHPAPLYAPHTAGHHRPHAVRVPPQAGAGPCAAPHPIGTIWTVEEPL